MMDILLTTKGLTPEIALRELGEHQDVIIHDNQCLRPKILHSFTPYSIQPPSGGGVRHPHAESLRSKVMTRLSAKGISKAISEPMMELGSEEAVALAEMMDALEVATINYTGATVSVTADRTSGFVQSVYRYQQALLRYRELSRAGGHPKNIVALAEIEVRRMGAEMQSKFLPELDTIVKRNRMRKRSSLHNVDRAIEVAKHNRTKRAVAKLSFTNQSEINRIIKFGQYANVVGAGLVAIDFGSRIGQVHTEYLSGGDWNRELFRESLSFVGATGFAFYGAKAAAALFLPILAPFGWVFLIIGGAALAGGLAAGSILIDRLIKQHSDFGYDFFRGL